MTNQLLPVGSTYTTKDLEQAAGIVKRFGEKDMHCRASYPPPDDKEEPEWEEGFCAHYDEWAITVTKENQALLSYYPRIGDMYIDDWNNYYQVCEGFLESFEDGEHCEIKERIYPNSPDPQPYINVSAWEKVKI